LVIRLSPLLLRRTLCAEGDSVPALDHQPQFPAVSMQAPMEERSRGRDQEGRTVALRAASFPYLPCTDAESLELARASSMLFQRGFSSKSQRIGEGLLATECDCRIKLTAPSSASQKPAAFPPALILTAKLPERFYGITGTRYDYSVLCLRRLEH
jgi:hypothetical protein